MRKALAYIILGSMTLYSAGKLSLLDQLYKQRNDIALAFGLINEVPIAMCSSDYDFDDNLKIEAANNEHALPSSLIPVQEINLFFVSVYFHSFRPEIILSVNQIIQPDNLNGFSLVTSVFHPPSA